MKILREESGYAVECAYCGVRYLVEWGDVQIRLPFDPDRLLTEAQPDSEALIRWDSYTGCRMYYRFWMVHWDCPACRRSTSQELSQLPSDWQGGLLLKFGFAGMRSPLDHPAIHEIDRRNFERYQRNLRRWESLGWFARHKMTPFQMFGYTSGACEHARRIGAAPLQF